MDVLFLSRLQFALTTAFHYLYPPLSIGLGLLLIVVEALWLRTKNPVYHQMARFWTKVFALTFALGVATGLVLEFEFGTNWATYSRYVGDVFGSALAAEGIFAFFLESGFLAVLLFGWDKVGPGLHFFATCMVALGAHFSAVWIIVANSWMQTPAGFKIVGEGLSARAEITDFWAMVFNPSSVDRLTHTLSGCWQAGAWLMVSVGAYYLLKKRHRDFGLACVKIGLAVAVVSTLFTAYTGHHSAIGVAKNQPAKLAAFEGLWDTQPKAPLYVAGWVDEKAQTTHGIAIPGALSLLTHANTAAPVTGLRDIPADERPPVHFTFQLYHLMIAVGGALLALAAWAVWALWRGKLEDSRLLLGCLTLSVLGPQIANQAGWWAAEVGRQPWIVYKLLRTSDALSKVVQANQVLASIIMFSVIYVLLFGVFIFLLNHKIQHGPDESDLVPTGKLARGTKGGAL
ncbi:MAG TPA: cytochrome ubiquinol oxidase subunit I [Opitutaceae bacterium]|jgi:cytochrome d ubiquinol oxidase subunit I|nr:cytochrome ubiquinol oxidase subunit I [Opitutaceae bacterium]HOF09479.1 cytochrome ubiquinol oxidase subunit I [Opitutaceae bacterium]HOR24566.1 cytochrome ubiquinol oxidase subunit I [Opitutaceae bacterium]HPK49392.1 cytochrome ubiquinol oxidase subunit I [Opitutaceae bacterium]HQL21001.1 cytochrome ubiquinol oxidase subunit I [Opitutaceae bacterium]